MKNNIAYSKIIIQHIKKYRTLTPEQKSAVDCLVEHFSEKGAQDT